MKKTADINKADIAELEAEELPAELLRHIDEASDIINTLAEEATELMLAEIERK